MCDFSNPLEQFSAHAELFPTNKQAENERALQQAEALASCQVVMFCIKNCPRCGRCHYPYNVIDWGRR